MKEWIRFEQGDFSFFIKTANITGICINKERPTELKIAMVGDEEESTVFTFPDAETRNKKLDEIFDLSNTSAQLEGQLCLGSL